MPNSISQKSEVLLGAQMLFVAFGALVLVPMLTGLDTSVALFTAGAGTLIFQLVTKRSVPIFLASSFAFIGPIIYSTGTWGVPVTMGALAVAGCFYFLLAGLVRGFGRSFIDHLFPPLVVGPIIMIIGLSLAPVAVNMALGKAGDGSVQLIPEKDALILSMLALAVTVLTSLRGRGILRLVPVLSAIFVSYIVAIAMDIVDFTPIKQASWVAIPSFSAPEFKLEAILFMIPVAIAPAIEHIGDMMAISRVTGKDILKKPGLHRTLLGDGLATTFASMLGGPPNTSYSEVTGAVALTKAFNPRLMTWAAVFAILLSFMGKLGAFLQTIPTPIMGGIMIILFGSITTIGVSTLAKSQSDLHAPRSLAIVSITLVFGIGGMYFGTDEAAMRGIGLAAITATLLNFFLPEEKNG